ncbi:MAG: hypothetical protein ACK559_04425, partial [bacterium]
MPSGRKREAKAIDIQHSKSPKNNEYGSHANNDHSFTNDYPKSKRLNGTTRFIEINSGELNSVEQYNTAAALRQTTTTT